MYLLGKVISRFIAVPATHPISSRIAAQLPTDNTNNRLVMTLKIKRVRLSRPSNKSKSLGTSASPSSDLALGVKSCSVNVTDLFSETFDKIVKLENEVKSLRAQQAQYEPMVKDLAALAYLISAPSKPDLNLAMGAGKLFNTIATEISSRIHRSKNAIVFNVPDKMDVNYIRCNLLNACGLNPLAGECIRLRKKQQKYSCPLLFKFFSDTDANTFIAGQALIQKIAQFRNVRIIRDRTPLERAFAANTASPSPTGTARTDHKAQAPVPEDVINPQASSGTASVPQPANAYAYLDATKPPKITPKPTQVIPVDLDISSTTMVSPTVKPLKLSPIVQTLKRNITAPNSSPTFSRASKRHASSASNSPGRVNFRPHTYSYGTSPSLVHHTRHLARQNFPEPLTYTSAGNAACDVADPRAALYTLPDVNPCLPLAYGPVAPPWALQNQILPSRANSGFFNGVCMPYPPPMITDPPSFISREHLPPGIHYPNQTHPFYTAPTRALV